jgi:hypothetical protein
LLRITEKDGGVVLNVRVQPRARRNEIAGVHGEALKIALTAPPVEGAANDACIAFLAKRFALPRSHVTIVAGHASRNKIIRLQGINKAQFEAALARSD